MPSPRCRLLAGSFLLAAAPAFAIEFNIVPLVSDDASAHPAQIVDPGLKNAWGISYSPTSPFWVSSAGAGTSVLYRVDPATQVTSKVALTVAVPGGVPTGQVFNAGNGSGAFNGNLFLFVSPTGTISGWRGALGTTAEVLVPAAAGNAYTGAAFSTIGGNSYLYAANFGASRIDVVKGTGAAPSLAGSFADPTLPAGYAPFNVQNLGGTLYVNYAVVDPATHDEMAGAGLGIVDAFDLQGNFLSRVATGGGLNAPWGAAIAPQSFGPMAGALLIGNFGDGHINAYDRTSFSFLGQVLGSDGQPLAIDGLWAITPGNDNAAGSSRLLYFSAGPDDEEHGVFGVLAAVPEPSTWASMLAGLLVVGALSRRWHWAANARATGP